MTDIGRTSATSTAAAEGAEAAIAIDEELADNGVNPTEAVRPRRPASGANA